MQAITTRLQPWLEFIRRHPRMLALVSFASGLASFFLVNRQNRSAAIIAGILLVSWVWLILENLLTERMAARFGKGIPPAALHYATQLVHQESLFFVLPFFLATTTWLSGQLFFTGMLGLAALVAIIDPVYYRWLATRRLAYMAFHTLALFAVVMTALPLIFHQTTDETYRYALAAVLLLSLPTLWRSLPEAPGWRTLLRLLLVSSLLGVTLWFGRYWIPPATVWLTNVHVTPHLNGEQRTPGKGIREISARRLHAGGLYAYTAIAAPRGLQEEVFHVWVHEGKEVDRIPLKVRGGRAKGYRTWSHKTRFPGEVLGDWEVRVLTAGGQMIGVTRFDVVSQ